MAGTLEVATKLANEFNITISSAKTMVATVLDTITEMAATDTIRIGKHTFKTVTRKARNGRNPKTGEALVIPEKQKLVYKHAKPGKTVTVAPIPEKKKTKKK
jgi:DNA-binding protein HU-beta